MWAEIVSPVAEFSAALLELLAIGIIMFVTVISAVAAVHELGKRVHWETVIHTARIRVSRGVIMGLEFLVAADIVHTVAIQWTFENIGVLSLIILVRAFLIFALEVEIQGRWPWQPLKDREQAPR